MIKVLATDLRRLMKNSAIYPQKRSSYGQVVRFYVAGDFLRAWSSDDFVYMMDQVPCDAGPHDLGQVFFLDLAAVKDMELKLRGTKEEDALLELVPSESTVALDGEHFYGTPEVSPEMVREWDVVEQLLEDSDIVRPYDQPEALFAVAPDRLRKLSLIQPGNDPIDIKYAWSELLDDAVVALKIGKNTRLRIAPLDRSIINEKKEGLLWD